MAEDVSAFGQHRKFPPHARKTSGTPGNAKYTKKQNLSRQHCNKFKHSLYYYPQTRGLSEGIWPLRGFFTVSLIPADFHTDKTHLIPECQEVPAKVRSGITEIKVTEINAPSINGAEIHVSKNVKYVF